MSEELIRRMQQRLRHGPNVDYVQCPPILPRPPVTAEVLSEAEAQLGFPLPPLLSALYTQVAGGGFGPGRGFFHLIGGEWSLVAHAKRACLSIDDDDVNPWWPPRLVEILSWGGHYTSAVDCSRPPFAVVFYNHDHLVGEATQADYLWPEAESLDEWLSAWLDGVDLSARLRERRRDTPLRDE